MERDGCSATLLVACLVFVLSVSLNVATLHRYGLTQDEPEHWYFGDRYLQYFHTFDRNALDFSGARWPAIQTWPVGPTLAALTAKVFSDQLKLVNVIDGHHLASILLFGLLLSGMVLFLSAYASRSVAVLSCLALVLQPRIFGDVHNNSQDTAHLAFYTVTILSLLHGMMAGRARWILAGGLCWGLALGSKINAVSVPLVIAPVLVGLVWDHGRHSAAVKRALAAVPFIACSILLLSWPYVWQDPLDRFASFRSYLLFWGYTGPQVWQAMPALNVAITTPPAILACALIGLVAAAWTGKPIPRRMTLCLVIWLAVPIVRSSIPGALNYNVIRRYMEFSSALAILAGIGVWSVWQWITRGGSASDRRWRWVAGTAVVSVLLSPVAAVWRYVPFESSYYNALVGGLGGAQAMRLQESTDYTLTSYRAGVKWLNAHADPGSFVLVGHGRHLLEYYLLRKDLVVSEDVWMDELGRKGRSVYLMYVPLDIYTYNMCLAEAFLRPAYEIRRDGGLILRIYRLAPDSPVIVTRGTLPPPSDVDAVVSRRWVTLTWKPAPIDNVVGHLVYYGRAPGQYMGSACVRDKITRWKVLADVPFGTYYLSMSALTRQAEETRRTPDIRREYTE